jgi:hypothetical protein
LLNTYVFDAALIGLAGLDIPEFYPLSAGNVGPPSIRISAWLDDLSGRTLVLINGIIKETAKSA